MTRKGCARIMLLATANFPLTIPKQIEATGQLWMEMFSDYDDDRMEKAMKHLLTYAKGFPTVADLKGALADTRTIKHNELPEYKQPKHSSDAIAQAFESVRTGRSRELMDVVDITEMREFCLSLLPDVTDRFIRNHYGEFDWCYQSHRSCQSCMWTPKECVTSGYKAVPEIRSSGFVNVVMAPCRKRGETSG